MYCLFYSMITKCSYKVCIVIGAWFPKSHKCYYNRKLQKFETPWQLHHGSIITPPHSLHGLACPQYALHITISSAVSYAITKESLQCWKQLSWIQILHGLSTSYFHGTINSIALPHSSCALLRLLWQYLHYLRVIFH